MTAHLKFLSLARSTRAATSLFVKDIGQGLLVVSHNTLALVGLAVVAVMMMFISQDNLRHQLEKQAFGWLSARQEARAEAEGNTLYATGEPDAVLRATAGFFAAAAAALGTGAAAALRPPAVLRATAANPKDLPRQQAAVAQWLSRRYKVAPEPISRLVQESWAIGQRVNVEPTLILAIMAIESGFNPFAQSSVGAQGLMQVLTRVHDAKYEPFGGTLAAFDPITNLRVGVQVLKDCIRRGGSVEEGLRHYVGAGNLADDSGYAARVLAEDQQMKAVIAGRQVPIVTPKPAREMAQPAPVVMGTDDQVALLH